MRWAGAAAGVYTAAAVTVGIKGVVCCRILCVATFFSEVLETRAFEGQVGLGSEGEGLLTFPAF